MSEKNSNKNRNNLIRTALLYYFNTCAIYYEI